MLYNERMASIELIKASDGSGNANVATVQNTRTAGSSTIIVDTVLGINVVGFVGSMGTPHTFTDPITSETITVISEATCVDFSGHVDGANLEIDDIAAGYIDLGSAVGDIIIIRPTTQYGDNLAGVLGVVHDDDGDLKDGIVTTIKILDLNVTTAKLADSAVTSAKVAAGMPVQMVSTTFAAEAHGTVTIPVDDTIPQNTEGDEYMTQAITPKSATNILIIEADLFLANSAASYTLVAALFQDAVANALAAKAGYGAVAGAILNIKVKARVVAGSTSAITFKARAGSGAAGTTTFNGAGAARLFGAIPKSTISITEYKA